LEEINMHFVHSLVKIRDDDKLGWYAPAELGDSTPHYISFVIPVDDSNALFEEYACEAVKIEKEGNRSVAHYEMTRSGKDAFVLKLKDARFWFVVRPAPNQERALRYVGKLEHPDFVLPLTEIEPEKPALLDKLCQDEDTFLIGCEPFTHYAGLKNGTGGGMANR
jgi:hypothetical protein